MIEWSERNKYNSFSSYKGLTYFEHYKKIVAWMKGKGRLPPPVECNLDPCAECNARCYFCITQRYLRNNRIEAGEMRKLPTEYMLCLVDLLYHWGVKGLCISGGGDPSLHGGVAEVLVRAQERGMKTSFFTNAIQTNYELMEAILGCQWVTLSVNSSNREEYKKIVGVDKFDKVVGNIKNLVEARKVFNSKTSLAFRTLILPENYKTIYEACKLAKELGVQQFNVRPVDFERYDIEGHKKLDFPVEFIKEQFERCHELEDEDFKVFTVVEKYDPEFHIVHNFERCLASPLLLPIMSDGNAYLCVDKKMEKNYKIGSAYPNPASIFEWWGSAEHRELIKSVNINSCSRCTFGNYNRQITEVVLKDSMCRSFP